MFFKDEKLFMIVILGGSGWFWVILGGSIFYYNRDEIQSTEPKRNSKLQHAFVNINNVKVKGMIDTGCSIDIDKNTFDRIKRKNAHIVLDRDRRISPWKIPPPPVKCPHQIAPWRIAPVNCPPSHCPLDDCPRWIFKVFIYIYRGFKPHLVQLLWHQNSLTKFYIYIYKVFIYIF